MRRALVPGDLVKLIFRLEREDGDVAVERMWVEVVTTGPYVGRLRNEPSLGGVLSFGTEVEFGPEHVCGYAYARSELGYDIEERCFLLERVAHAARPPARLVLNPEGDWEAHAEDETDEEVADVDNVLAWSLGYLTDRFPAAADALREGSSGSTRALRRTDSAWWHWDGDRYVRAE